MHNDGIKSVNVIEFFLDLLVGGILDVVQRQVGTPSQFGSLHQSPGGSSAWFHCMRTS